MSVVWEDENVGGFCDFPWWDLCTVSFLGSSVSLVLVGDYCLCVAPRPTASIPKASHLWLQAGIIVPGSWGDGAALPSAVFWLALISIS